MRKFYGIALLMAAFGILSAASTTQAQEFDPADRFSISDNLFADGSPYTLAGWEQFGYTNNSTGLFNTNPHMLNLHQSWLYFEKAVDGSDGLDIGGRIDFMYGTDADDTQAFGNNDGVFDYDGTDPGFWANHGIYGFAIPQLYAEVAVGDLSVKLGHFYTLLGYEVVTAPDNFFFSHAFTMYNSEAFTHTGALASYAASDSTTIYAGWTLGWDTGFDQFNGGSSFLGGFSTGVSDNVTFTYITTFGNFGAIGDGYSHSIVLDFALTDNLNYVFQSDVLNTNQDVLGDGGTTYHTVGINQYLFYTISEKLAVGGRAEWWKANGGSVYQMTAGVNIKPCQNLVIRPEIRYQWSPVYEDFPVVADTFSLGKGIFGIDAILTF